MNIDSILSADRGLTLILGDQGQSFTDICSVESISSNGLIFIKNRKFLATLLEKNVSEFGVIIDGPLFDKNSDELISVLKEKDIQFIIKSSNIDISMSIISKIGYDHKYRTLNLNRSGIVSETAKIGEDSDIAPTAFIGEDVVIGDRVLIMAGAVVMSGSKIGDGTWLFPNVTIYPFVSVGKDCRIHSNSVIGGDGFGYNYFEGVHHKLWHFGGVIIGDSVEIGSNVSIDAGTFSPTKLGTGSKIDNQIQIGHNSLLGQGVIMCGQSGTSGSCKLGDFTVMGGKSGIGPGVSVGAQSQIAGAALVTKDCPPKSILAGYPAVDIKEWLKTGATIRRLMKSGK